MSNPRIPTSVLDDFHHHSSMFMKDSRGTKLHKTCNNWKYWKLITLGEGTLMRYNAYRLFKCEAATKAKKCCTAVMFKYIKWQLWN